MEGVAVVMIAARGDRVLSARLMMMMVDVGVDEKVALTFEDSSWRWLIDHSSIYCGVDEVNVDKTRSKPATLVWDEFRPTSLLPWPSPVVSSRQDCRSVTKTCAV
jgi:hypothetical protein